MPDIQAPPTEPGPLGTPKAAWPTTLGIISIVLGGIGLLFHGCFSASRIGGGVVLGTINKGSNGGAGGSAEARQMMDAIAPWMIASGVASALCAVAAALLLVSGIMLLNRKRTAVAMHLWWAGLRIVAALLTAGTTIGTQMAQFRAVVRAQTSTGGAGALPSWTGAISGSIQALIFFMIAAAYPIVVVLYFRRRDAREEFARWSR